MADGGIGGGDPRDEIERLEEDIDDLAAQLESCRKFILAARIAVAAGAVVLAAMLLGAIATGVGLMASAMAAVLGGIVVWGSNDSTAKETAAEIAAAESRRAALIGMLDLHTIPQQTLH